MKRNLRVVCALVAVFAIAMGCVAGFEPKESKAMKNEKNVLKAEFAKYEAKNKTELPTEKETEAPTTNGDEVGTFELVPVEIPEKPHIQILEVEVVNYDKRKDAGVMLCREGKKGDYDEDTGIICADEDITKNGTYKIETGVEGMFDEEYEFSLIEHTIMDKNYDHKHKFNSSDNGSIHFKTVPGEVKKIIVDYKTETMKLVKNYKGKVIHVDDVKEKNDLAHEYGTDCRGEIIIDENRQKMNLMMDFLKGKYKNKIEKDFQDGDNEMTIYSLTADDTKAQVLAEFVLEELGVKNPDLNELMKNAKENVKIKLGKDKLDTMAEYNYVKAYDDYDGLFLDVDYCKLRGYKFRIGYYEDWDEE